MSTSILRVGQLNFYLKSVIEGDPRLQGIFVKGEISNLKNHYSSGHIYFTLKDDEAAINCIMFRSFAQRVKFDLANGMEVTVRGRVSVYERDGQNRLYVEEISPDGIGDIALRFQQTKEKLERDGLFDPESKRTIPEFPKKIGVVTSESGAAVRDILNILSRRWAPAEVLLCPVSVQGDLAVPEMLAALDKLYTLGDIDVCIIGRGGGSAEDLWAFNDERLAYKIYESPFPVISAVGHETDFTICDFVADLRAPTPSAAAELAVPDSGEMTAMLKNREAALYNLLKSKAESCRLRFEKTVQSNVLKNPLDLVYTRAELVDKLSERIINSLKEKVNDCKLSLGEQTARLDALSPLKTLARGYAVASIEGKTVQSVKKIKDRDILNIRFADGQVKAQVQDIRVK